MKILKLLALIFLSFHAYTQNNFPAFLQGTWKMEMEDRYESWTLIDPGFLKGYAYELKDGVAITKEFLELKKRKRKSFIQLWFPDKMKINLSLFPVLNRILLMYTKIKITISPSKLYTELLLKIRWK